MLSIELTCNVYCARQERVAVSYFCQVSQVTVLYYQSIFIAVFTFTALLSLSWEVYGKCVVLPSTLDLQGLLSPATVCTRAVQDIALSPLGIREYILLSWKHFKQLTAAWSLTLTANRVRIVRAVQGSMPRVYKLSTISQQPLKLKASSWNKLSTEERSEPQTKEVSRSWRVTKS